MIKNIIEKIKEKVVPNYRLLKIIKAELDHHQHEVDKLDEHIGYARSLPKVNKKYVKELEAERDMEVAQYMACLNVHNSFYEKKMKKELSKERKRAARKA